MEEEPPVQDEIRGGEPRGVAARAWKKGQLSFEHERLNERMDERERERTSLS
jgi:ferric-dicitrate binding protein FerR (iron transport regulator)